MVQAKFMEVDHFATLGIKPSASPADVRKAFRQQALLHHPDKAAMGDKEAATKRFQQLAMAYEILKDLSVQKAYEDVYFQQWCAAPDFSAEIDESWFGHSGRPSGGRFGQHVSAARRAREKIDRKRESGHANKDEALRRRLADEKKRCDDLRSRM